MKVNNKYIHVCERGIMKMYVREHERGYVCERAGHIVTILEERYIKICEFHNHRYTHVWKGCHIYTRGRYIHIQSKRRFTM